MALRHCFSGEADSVFTDDHPVAVDGPFGRIADNQVGVDGLLELGEDGLVVVETEDFGFLLFAALFLDALECLVFVVGFGALASGGAFKFVGDVQQVAGQGALLWSGQVSLLVSGQRTAHSAQMSAVDGRGIDVDFLRVANDADHVRLRVDIDESVDGAADMGQDFLLGVLNNIVLGDGELDIVNLNLLRGGEEFDFFVVQVDGDDLQHEITICSRVD